MNAVVQMKGAQKEGHNSSERASRRDSASEQNAAWEVDRVVMAKRSEKRAWIIAGVSVFLAVMSVAAVFVQGPLRQVVPVAVVVDKTTGAANVESRLSETTIPPLEALDMHNVATFVRARETYNWSFLQDDYDQVARMSTPQVFAGYNKLFSSSVNLPKTMGSVGEYRINIINVRLPLGGRSGNAGEAVVTFDKTTKDPKTMELTTQRYVAQVKFVYRPSLLEKEKDRIENPFGFLVTAYRATPELTDAKQILQ